MAPKLGAKRPEEAADYVRRLRVLPVLDGLDELDLEPRRMAIRELSRALGRYDPVVLTCRTDQFAEVYDVLATDPPGGPPLAKPPPMVPKAAAVELQPLRLEDVETYLTGEAPEELEPKWQPVLSHLGKHRDGPLANRLTTPLMLWLAHEAYGRTSTGEEDAAEDPSELVKEEGVQTEIPGHNGAKGAERVQLHLEEFLFGKFIPSTAALRWLAFLTSHLQELNSLNLAWWELRDKRTTPRYQLEVAAGAMAGLVFGPLLALLGGRAISLGLGLGPVLGLLFGFTFGIGYTLTRSVGHRRGAAASKGRGAPGGFRAAAGPGILGRRLWYGMVTVLVAWLTAAGVVGLAHLLGIRPAPVLPGITLKPGPVLSGLAVAMSLSLVAGLLAAVAAGTVLQLSPRQDEQRAAAHAKHPLETFEKDRTNTLLLGAISSLAVGITTGITLLAIHGELGQALPSYGLPAAVGGALTGGIPALMMFTAWATFVPTWIWLACRGRLPWQVMTFLEQAREQGVLRQFGAYYQFRHPRLQQWLATTGARAARSGRGPSETAPDPVSTIR